MSDQLDPTHKTPTKDVPTPIPSKPAGLSESEREQLDQNWKYIHEKEKGT
jgi:hypothetical protein